MFKLMNRALAPAFLALILLLSATSARAAWPFTFGSTGNDAVQAMVSDGAGNLYLSISFKGSVNLLGTTINSGTKQGVALAKVVESTGTLAWVRVVTSTTLDMAAPGLRYGSSYIYWGGSYGGTISFLNGLTPIRLTSKGGYDGFVAKYNTRGDCQWANSIGGVTGDELINAIAISRDGVVVGGSYTGPFNFRFSGTYAWGGTDSYAAEFTAAGEENRFWAGYCKGNDNIKGLEVIGNTLWACGYYTDTMLLGNTWYYGNGHGQDAFVFSSDIPETYYNNGAYFYHLLSSTVYVNEIKSPNSDETDALAITNQGYVVAASKVSGVFTWNGLALNPYGGTDILLTGYTANTQPAWGNLVGSTGNDSPNTLMYDGSRAVLGATVSGTLNTRSGFNIPGLGGQDGLLMRFNPTNGVPVSGQMLGGTGSDFVTGVAFDRSTQRTFAGGGFTGTATFPGGRGNSSNGLFDGFAVSLATPTARLGLDEAEPEPTALLKPYPNPAQRTLRMGVAWEEAATIRVLNAKGQIKAVPILQDTGEAVLDISALPAGLYSIRAGAHIGSFVKE